MFNSGREKSGLLNALIEHLTVLLEYVDLLSKVTGHKTHGGTEAGVPTLTISYRELSYFSIGTEVTICRVAAYDAICL